jgi:TPR repeat protein
MSDLDNLENDVDTLKNYLLGLSYAEEHDEHFDPEKAVYFLRRSLEVKVTSDRSITNHIKYLIGKICLENNIDHNASQNHLKLIEESAENECFIAQLYLGHAYFFGNKHIERNDELGVYWWQKTSDQGDFFTRYCLAAAYFNGKGVEQDHQKAVELAETVPLEEVPSVSLLLGKAYMSGLGTTKDTEKAVKFFQSGAQRGNPVSQFELGSALTSGDGIGADQVEAFKWYLKSAEGGYARAQGWLGVLYSSGQGVERDLEKAKYWTSLGAKNGDGFAINFQSQIPEAKVIAFPKLSDTEIEDKILRSTIQSLSVDKMHEMFTAQQRAEFKNLYQKSDEISSTHVFDRSTRQLISTRENDYVECKETYETEAGTDKRNKSLKRQVAKEIVGFLNSCDGVLLIGVSDKKKVTGIEADGFNGDEDKFSLKIIDFLVQCCGPVAASSVKIKFENLEEKTVCRIEVTKSLIPIYLDFDNKSGEKSGQAYIRVDSSTRVPRSTHEWDDWRDVNFQR